MKMMSLKMMCLATGITIAGYMFLKMYPEKVKEMKGVIKDTSKKVYNMMEEE